MRPTPSLRRRTKKSRGGSSPMRSAIAVTASRSVELRVARQRHRMDPDVVRDDELHARQTDAGVRNRGQREGPPGSPTMSMISRAGLRNARCVESIDRERDAAGIDVPFRAFGAADRHLVVRRRERRVAFRADDAGQSELARDDRRVRGPAALIGHDRGHASHRRLPVRIGLLRDSTSPVCHRRQRLHVVDDARTARRDLSRRPPARSRAACRAAPSRR